MLSISIVSQDTTAGVSLDFCSLSGLALEFLMWTYGELVTLSSKWHSYVRSVFTGTYHQMSWCRPNLVIPSDGTTSTRVFTWPYFHSLLSLPDAWQTFPLNLAKVYQMAKRKTVAIPCDVLWLMQHTMHAQDSVDTLQQDNCYFFLTPRFSESSPSTFFPPPFWFRSKDPGEDFCSFIYHSSHHP